MNPPKRKFWRWPLALSGLLLLSQVFSLPSPVRNAATGAWAEGFSMHLPRLYIDFAPVCGLADRLILLSYHQAVVAWVYVVAAGFLLFGLRRWFISLFVFIPFLVWAALAPRPTAKLMANDPDILLIDFHSHSEGSHDGRPGFSADANRRWHWKQGYNASFITDHNKIDSSKKAKELSRADWKETGYRSLEGEEISLWKTHLVTLGVHERIDNQPYDSDPMKVPLFIKDMRKRNIPVIASLPEYWFYHWPAYDSDGKMQSHEPDSYTYDFVRWGISGFEIINSVPKALDFPPSYRREIVELCRKNNLFMTGISDTHGYGSATAAWNAMRIPGWQGMDPDQLESAVLKTLRTGGFQAVEVLERVRYNPENFAGLLAAPFMNLVLYWRSLSLPEILSWVAWIWIAFGIRRRLKLSYGR